MQLAYNTNGLANHNLLDAIGLLADIGYSGISITLDHGALNPYDQDLDAQLDEVAGLLANNSLGCVIETGARFLLDPLHKHEPTLVSPGPAARASRIDFLNRAIDVAARLNADCVSLWSGIVHDGEGEAHEFRRLIESLPAVLEKADERQVTLAFEPEPGMLIDTVNRYNELLDRLSSNGYDASRLGLTIDVGHLHCQGELPIAEKIRASRNRLVNVH